MGKRRPTNPERAEVLLHASVFGDEAATQKYGYSARSLRNWRAEVRDPESDLAASFRQFQEAVAELQGDESGAAQRATSILDFIDGQVRELSAVILEKARQINAANPAGIESVNGHVATLLGHAAALQYIAAATGGAPSGEVEP